MNVNKEAGVDCGLEVSPEELKAINAMSKKKLRPEEVYAFAVRLCDNEIDRDNERFPAATLEALAPLLPPKAQTLVCGGLEPAEVAALLARAGARGVDRVVPLGQALEMDTVWDGRDLIAALSRIIG